MIITFQGETTFHCIAALLFKLWVKIMQYIIYLINYLFGAKGQFGLLVISLKLYI